MDIVKALFVRSQTLMLLTVIAGCASAITSIALIHLVNQYLTGSITGKSLEMLIVFLALIIVSGVTAYWAHVVVTRLGLDVTYNLTTLLIARVLGTKLRKLEELGRNRLYATVTGDINSINSAASMLPNTIISAGCLVVGAAYMIYLAWQFVFILAGLALCTAFISMVSSRILNTHFMALRENMDELHQCYQGVFDGTKELKLDRKFADYFVEQVLLPVCQRVKALGLTIGKKYALHYNLNLGIFFLVIAYVIFAPQSWSGISLDAATGIAITLLYIQGPINELFQAVPTIIKGNIALKRIKRITEGALDDAAFPPQSQAVLEKIEYRELSYSYSAPGASNEENTFQLGPLDICLTPGRIIFITGGNGAGKSTLGKLLTGLYGRSNGDVFINGAVVENGDEYHLRSFFSAIFADFHLFREMAEMYLRDQSTQELNKMVDHLGLSSRVDFARNQIPTTELSQGQKKRLALMFAIASDRPVFLFDEWAADQDPSFREYFYLTILPQLKKQGKCAVVISHDDRYFHCADDLYHLEYGVLNKFVRQSAAAGL